MHGTNAAMGLALCALASTGCLTGHVIDAGRRYEQVDRFHEVTSDGEQLYVRYTARVTTESGEVVSRRERTASVYLDELSGGETPVDSVAVQWVDESRTPARGWKPLSALQAGLHAGRHNGNGAGGTNGSRNGNGRDAHPHGAPSDGNGGPGPAVLPAVASAVPHFAIRLEGDRHAELVVLEPIASPGRRLHAASLTRDETALWVWPLVPFAAVFDLFGTPAMLVLAGPLVLIGD